MEEGLGIAAKDEFEWARARRDSCGTATSSCEKIELWKEALILLRQMPFKWLLPDVFSYSAVISSCDKIGYQEREKAFALLQEIFVEVARAKCSWLLCSSQLCTRQGFSHCSRRSCRKG